MKLSNGEMEPNTDTYSEYLGKLMGVINANVVFSDGEIVEVHILADTSRSPKQIVRDVQSLFMAQFHKEVDHRIISVAQIDCDMGASGKSASRFVIEGLTIGKKRDHTEIEVVLSQNGNLCMGSATALKDNVDIYRGVAQATMCAVAKAASAIQSYSVVDVRFSHLREKCYDTLQRQRFFIRRR